MHGIGFGFVFVVALLIGGRAADVFAQTCSIAADCDDGNPRRCRRTRSRADVDV